MHPRDLAYYRRAADIRKTTDTNTQDDGEEHRGGQRGMSETQS